MTEKDNQTESYDFEQWTVKQLREFAAKNHIKIPSKSKKNDIINLLKE
ncbi:MAG: hypothetical protein ACFFCC_19410, partial [Promethearchaeota archaeon]